MSLLKGYMRKSEKCELFSLNSYAFDESRVITSSCDG